MLQTSLLNERLSYDVAWGALKQANYDMNTVVLTQSYLRSEFTGLTTQAAYNVPVLQTDTINGPSFPTEKRLALQDSFVVSGVGMYLASPASAADGAYRLVTFPDPTLFATAGAAAALWALYNAYMYITVNQRQLVVAWPLLRHYIANQTQGGVGVTAQTVFPIDQNDFSTDAIAPIMPTVIFVGSTKISVTVQMSQAIATLQASTGLRVVFIWYGHLAQNSTSVNNV